MRYKPIGRIAPPGEFPMGSTFSRIALVVVHHPHFPLPVAEHALVCTDGVSDRDETGGVRAVRGVGECGRH